MSGRKKIITIVVVAVLALLAWGGWRYNIYRKEEAAAHFYGTWYAAGTMPKGDIQYHCYMNIAPLKDLKIQGNPALCSFGMVWKTPGNQSFQEVPAEAVAVMIDGDSLYALTADAQKNVKKEKVGYYDEKNKILQIRHFAFKQQDQEQKPTAELKKMAQAKAKES